MPGGGPVKHRRIRNTVSRSCPGEDLLNTEELEILQGVHTRESTCETQKN